MLDHAGLLALFNFKLRTDAILAVGRDPADFTKSVFHQTFAEVVQR
jgi:hypothetical protein